MTDDLAAELRQIITDLDAPAHRPHGRERLFRLAEHVEQLGTTETTTVTGELDLTAAGLEPDQEIRARALTLAIDAIADIDSHNHYTPLMVAAQFAEWIRSGWPRIEGNDGRPPS